MALPLLTEDDFRQIELLNDLLANTGDGMLSLQRALECILPELGQSQAALFIPRETAGGGVWLKHAVPQHWLNELEDARSHLNLLAAKVVSNGAGHVDADSLEGSTIFSIDSPRGTAGALFVYGPAIPPAQIPRWQAYLRPIGRALNLLRYHDAAALVAENIHTVQKLEEIQNQGEDLSLLQRTALEQLRDIFRAEDALLILLEENSPRLTITYHLSKSQAWIEQRNLVLEDAAIARAIRDGASLVDPAALEQTLLPWLARVSGTDGTRMIYAPMAAGNLLMGAVFLINPEVANTDPLDRFLKLIVSKIANSIQTMREVQNFKITIANIEANRWEILNSRNTLRAMFDSITSSVYIIDLSYTLMAINYRRSNRAGKRPNVLVGKKCYEQLFNRTDPCPSCRIQETFTNNSITTRYSREWVEPDRYIEWEITSYPIQEKNNRTYQVIVFEHDITEKRNLETNLIQSEKLAVVGQLAAGVAHEINNPLAAIIANAQILKKELPADNPDWQDSAAMIEIAGNRAAQVVSNLLSIARKERKYVFEPFSINEAIRSALSLVHHEIINRSIAVSLDLQEDMPEFLGSKNHLQGVWINLIMNGLDAMDKPQGKMAVTSRYSDGEFRVTVTDNGKGIPEKQLGRIFEPFFTTKTVGKGTGLGLSVCMQVVKEHQGNIAVESQPGVGTRFIVTLPDSRR